MAEYSQNIDELRDFYLIFNNTGPVTSDDDIILANLRDRIVGTVRLSQENGVYIMRGMFVHEAFQKQAIGRKMLSVFEEHLKNRDISQAFLIRGPHLEAFYGQIGFHKTDSSAPQFLMERSRSYEKCYGKQNVLKFRIVR